MKKKLIYIVVIVLGLALFLYSQNNFISITKYSIPSDNLPKSFQGYKLVHLTDLHNKNFGKNQEPLVRKIQKQAPDLIVITGDLIDSKKYNEEISLNLIQQIMGIAPVYFVTGNHEAWSGKFPALEEKLTSLGVHILRNASKKIELEDEFIQLVGLEDPAFATSIGSESGATTISLQQAVPTEEGFTVVLAHRPEHFLLYAEQKVDLILAGHAHGGQVRIPLIGGLVAPNQGFLPKYDYGRFEQNQSTMIVGRGLGNSIIPQRIFNSPELVVITLEQE
ncbi:metallophosphoesterase [Bacillus sp. 2205SS5-2]|uniref:metallophosphoesterase n=1 Tax=Bacillus sp. 2205SS5-2 TaxID=3109031 RepID=UPI0030051C95